MVLRDGVFWRVHMCSHHCIYMGLRIVRNRVAAWFSRLKCLILKMSCCYRGRCNRLGGSVADRPMQVGGGAAPWWGCRCTCETSRAVRALISRVTGAFRAGYTGPNQKVTGPFRAGYTGPNQKVTGPFRALEAHGLGARIVPTPR